MKRLLAYLSYLKGRQDVVLAILLLIAVFMMILPLPTGLVDGLIAFNLTISVVLLMLAIYTSEPLEFSAFPAVLLITTLYRLSLSISTTRLILLQHDAGEIVYTFGNYVVGGNLVVGLIIFTIITIVQFIVITKGAERVAEVGARFSLDAMPGKQMSIDGDMRAGMIDANEARRLRGLVQKESQLYGAMDGAMKFVKGDAIAGIIVIFVNILGGICIGVFQKGMNAGEAAQLYAILSVGDGLISQIPALLISITAGIIVTRVPGEERKNLGVELAQQLGNRPQALLVASVMLLVFGLLPGFPKLVFLGFAIVISSGAYYLHKNKPLLSASGSASGTEKDTSEFKPGAVPLKICLPHNLNTQKLKHQLDELGLTIFESLGLSLPLIEIEEAKKGVHTVTIKVYQSTVWENEFPENKCMFKSTEAIESGLEPVTFSCVEPQMYWIDTSAVNTYKEKGTIFEGEKQIGYILHRVILKYIKEFLGIQETRFLMDAMEGRYSELIKELQRQVQIGRIADVLQRLIEEQVSIRDLRSIFEALITWSPKEKDVLLLTEYIRIALGRHIVSSYQNAEGSIKGFMIGSTIENVVRESIRQSSSGSYVSLPPAEKRDIVEAIKSGMSSRLDAVLLTSMDVRRFIRKMIERDLFDVAVLSFQEIAELSALDVIQTIEMIKE